MAMKVLVVFIFAVITGCSANLLFADQPKPKLEVLVDTLSDSVRTARRKVEDTFEKFEQTEFGKDLTTSLKASGDVAGRYAELAWEQLPDGVQGAMITATLVVLHIDEIVDDGVKAIKKKLEPITERVAPVAEKVESALTQRSQQVIDFASPYVEKLREKVDPVVQNVQTRLDTLYESFFNTN